MTVATTPWGAVMPKVLIIATWIVDSQAGISTILVVGEVVCGVSLVEYGRRVAGRVFWIVHDTDIEIYCLGFEKVQRHLPNLIINMIISMFWE